MEALWEFISTHKAVAVFVGMAIIGWVALALYIPVVVSSLPTDYFSCEKEPLRPSESDHHISPTKPSRILRNILALFLIFVAPILLQSIFAPIIGLAIGEFKWKHKALKRLGRSRRMVDALNRIRLQHNHPPFTKPAAIEGDRNGNQRHA